MAFPGFLLSRSCIQRRTRPLSISVAKCMAEHPRMMRMTHSSSNLIWDASHLKHKRDSFPCQRNVMVKTKLLFSPFLMISQDDSAEQIASSHTLQKMEFCLVLVHEICSTRMCATTVPISAKLDSFSLAAKCECKECNLPEVCLVSMHGCVRAQTGFALELPTRWRLFLLLWEMLEICIFFPHLTNGFPSGWQSPLSLVETHESFQDAVVPRGYVSASMFAFGITSLDAVEQLIQDILLNTEAMGSTSGITAAKCEHPRPHAASNRRATHESWGALPRDEHKSAVGRLQTCLGLTPSLSRGSRWRHRTKLWSAFWAQTIQGNSTQTALQVSGVGHWATTP